MNRISLKFLTHGHLIIQRQVLSFNARTGLQGVRDAVLTNKLVFFLTHLPDATAVKLFPCYQHPDGKRHSHRFDAIVNSKL